VNYTVPSQVISSLTPSTGPVGTQVTLNGVAFGTTQGTSVLTFNGQPATAIASWSDGQIVATVPVTAASGPVKVAVNGINSNNDLIFTVPPPSESSVTPGGGTVGTQVTIAGSGFQANQRDSTVSFNGVVASVTSWSDTQIVTSVPAGATTGPLLVTVNSVNSSSAPFEVTNLTITSLLPTEAPAGGIVTITGTGFGASNANSGSVRLNGDSAHTYVTFWSDTSIKFEVLDNAPSGNLTVTKYDATSNALPFSVEGAPTVTGLAPSAGPVGGTVTISGNGFGPSQSGNSVQFAAGANAFGQTRRSSVGAIPRS